MTTRMLYGAIPPSASGDWDVSHFLAYSVRMPLNPASKIALLGVLRGGVDYRHAKATKTEAEIIPK